MLVLGIESSTNVASVAVGDETGIIGQMTINTPRTHSQKLMPMVEQLFESLGITAKDIDMIGVTTGPGSFTGIRIGLSVAKAIAHPFNIPIVPMTSLKSLAYNMDHHQGNILTIIKANKTSVYAAGYHWNGVDYVAEIPEGNYKLEDLIEIVGNHYDSFMVVGLLDASIKGTIISQFGDRVTFSYASTSANSAVSVVNYALMSRDKSLSLYDLEATYYKLSEAEETLLKKKGKLDQ